MIYPINTQSDDELRKLFIYQTRIGIAPHPPSISSAGGHFGSRPINWYQTHQLKAYDYICAIIRDMKLNSADIRVRHGMLQIKDKTGKWINNISTYQIFNLVDMNVRK